MSYYIATDRFGNYDLAHHGILGQKWGIRRYQNKDGSLTPAGEKRYASDRKFREKIIAQKNKKILKDIKNGDNKTSIIDPRGHQESVSGYFMGQNRDEDIKISKDSIGYRVQKNAVSSHEDGHTYLTFDPQGHLEYLALTTTTSGDGAGLFDGAFDDSKDIKGYSVKLKLTEDLILPSYKKSMEAFTDAIGKVGVKEVSKIVEKYNYKANDFLKDVRNMTVEECRNRAYENFIRVVAYNPQLKAAFFNNLKSQGYNAIIDDNDFHFGKGGFSGTPVIVFDKGKSTKVKEITAIDKAKAQNIEEVWDQYGEMARKRISNMEQLEKYWKENDAKHSDIVEFLFKSIL